MKQPFRKILYAVLAVITAISLLVGCGEEPQNVISTETETTQTQDPPAEIIHVNTKLGMEIKDVEALLKLLGVEQGMDVKDLAADITANGEGDFLLSLGAALLGKEHRTALFGDDNFVFSSTLLDKSYGWSDTASFIRQLENAFTDGADTNSVPAIDIHKVLSLAKKYYGFVFSQIENYGFFTESKQDGKNVIYGSIESDSAAAIIANLYGELISDSDFYSAFSIDRDEFSKKAPTRDELESKLISKFEELGLRIHIGSVVMDSEGKVLSMEMNVYLDRLHGGVRVLLAFDMLDGSFEFSVYRGQMQYVLLKSDPKKTEISIFKSKGDKNRVEMWRFELNIYKSTGSVYVEWNHSGNNQQESMDGTFYQNENNNEGFKFSVNKEGIKLSFGKEDLFDRTANGVQWIESETHSAAFELIYTKDGFDLKLEHTDKMHDGKNTENSYEDKYTVTAQIRFSENYMNAEILCGEERYTVRITYTDTEIMAEVALNGRNEFEIKMSKRTDGTKRILSVDSMTAGDTVTDMSDIGISFYIDTDADMERLPDYTLTDGMSAEELRSIADTFVSKLKDALKPENAS